MKPTATSLLGPGRTGQVCERRPCTDRSWSHQLCYRFLYHNARKSPGSRKRAVITAKTADTFALAAADYCFTERSIDWDFRMRRIVSQTRNKPAIERRGCPQRRRDLIFHLRLVDSRRDAFKVSLQCCYPRDSSAADHRDCHLLHPLALQSHTLANSHGSVCIISIIRLVVLSRLASVDLTCMYKTFLNLPGSSSNSSTRELRQFRHLVRSRTIHGRHQRLHPQPPSPNIPHDPRHGPRRRRQQDGQMQRSQKQCPKRQQRCLEDCMAKSEGRRRCTRGVFRAPW